MNVRNTLLLLASAALLGGSAGPAHAWDRFGHKVIARIAWDHMSPAAREKAVALLMAAPAGAGLRELMPIDGRPLAVRQRELFVNAAYWPDQIRSRNHPGNRFDHGDWHYVNIFWEQQRPGGPVIERPDLGTAGELVTQERRIAQVLGDTSRPAEERAVELAWLLHLIGDAHQPLHNSARVTPFDLEGDRGGNLFLLMGLYPFSNLHAYWDAMVGFAVPWQADDRTEHDYIESAATIISGRHPMARDELRLGEFDEWAREGVRVAQRAAFPVWLSRGDPVPSRYRPFAWRAAEPRVALAGYRLAATLNQLLGS